MINENAMYERKKEEIIRKHSKKGTLSPLGKWEIAKLFMLYYPDKRIKSEEYHL